jgi:bacteriorhodopsin
VINPIRSEREAFRFLLYAIGVAAAVVVLALVIRAL